jgi:hypothetical protein
VVKPGTCTTCTWPRRTLQPLFHCSVSCDGLGFTVKKSLPLRSAPKLLTEASTNCCASGTCGASGMTTESPPSVAHWKS